MYACADRRATIFERLCCVNVLMFMPITDRVDRIWSLYRDYFHRLNFAGFANKPTQKLHIATGHILNRLEPSQLKDRIRSKIQWRKDGRFDTNNFPRFKRALVSQAKELQEEWTIMSDLADKETKAFTFRNSSLKAGRESLGRYRSSSSSVPRRRDSAVRQCTEMDWKVNVVKRTLLPVPAHYVRKRRKAFHWPIANYWWANTAKTTEWV